MKKAYPKTAEELEVLIVKNPIQMYFRMHIGLRDMVNRNGEDTMDVLEELAESFVELAICLLTACKHLMMLLCYPAVKLVMLMKLRRMLIEHPGLLKMTVSTEEKCKE